MVRRIRASQMQNVTVVLRCISSRTLCSILKRFSNLTPHHPARRGCFSNAVAWRSCTKKPERQPAPELRYLYEHHAAKSTMYGGTRRESECQ